MSSRAVTAPLRRILILSSSNSLPFSFNFFSDSFIAAAVRATVLSTQPTALSSSLQVIGRLGIPIIGGDWGVAHWLYSNKSKQTTPT